MCWNVNVQETFFPTTPLLATWKTIDKFSLPILNRSVGWFKAIAIRITKPFIYIPIDTWYFWKGLSWIFRWFFLDRRKKINAQELNLQKKSALIYKKSCFKKEIWLRKKKWNSKKAHIFAKQNAHTKKWQCCLLWKFVGKSSQCIFKLALIPHAVLGRPSRNECITLQPNTKWYCRCHRKPLSYGSYVMHLYLNVAIN